MPYQDYLINFNCTQKKFWMISFAYILFLALFAIFTYLGYLNLECQIVSAIFLLIFIFVLENLTDDFIFNEQAKRIDDKEKKKFYKEGLLKISKTLESHEINSKYRFEILKSECEKRIKPENKGFLIYGVNAFEILIAVPLSTLLTSLISPESNATPMNISFVIIFGVSILFLMKLCKLLFDFLDDNRKDIFLLEIIHEYEYSDFWDKLPG
ncbi:Uncharacterised protein [Acetobacterium wieringae]|nr:Uncharacterised protein [Acetobacterium wieringae]